MLRTVEFLTSDLRQRKTSRENTYQLIHVGEQSFSRRTFGWNGRKEERNLKILFIIRI